MKTNRLINRGFLFHGGYGACCFSLDGSLSTTGFLTTSDMSRGLLLRNGFFIASRGSRAIMGISAKQKKMQDL